jgi:protein-L-isoaspartate(D-aspartate) O-methyltransferase
MVERQLHHRGIHDERVLEAMNAVPRELFVPESERRRAYNDSALPIGFGQTISQPWIVAAIAQALALSGDERVLDVGSGSGYSTAVLAYLASGVIGIERVPELAERSRGVLAELGVANAEIIAGDGSEGLPERAPFDAILVAAAFPEVPPPLAAQLASGGRLVQPIGPGGDEDVVLFERGPQRLVRRRTVSRAHFVRLYGAYGFPGGAD